MTLSSDEIHVWEFNLDEAAGWEPSCRLDPGECARARGFRFERDRGRFVARRAILRTLLGRYLNRPPGAIRFQVNRFGKPEIEGGGIQFSVSHSDGLALLAFCRVPLGVDVEKLRPIPDAQRVAACFFSAAEQAKLAAIGEAERNVAFLECWTRKECFVKGIGRGLSYPLDCFEVSFSPGEPASLLRHPEPCPWYLTALRTEGSVGAVAVPEAGLRLMWRTWGDS